MIAEDSPAAAAANISLTLTWEDEIPHRRGDRPVALTAGSRTGEMKRTMRCCESMQKISKD